MEEPIHGKAGWQLVDYKWNEDTGNGRFVYARNKEFKVVNKIQKEFWTHPDQRTPLEPDGNWY